MILELPSCLLRACLHSGVGPTVCCVDDRLQHSCSCLGGACTCCSARNCAPFHGAVLLSCCNYLFVVFSLRCVEVTDDGLEAVAGNLKQLRVLRLYANSAVTDVAVAAFAQLKHLQARPPPSFPLSLEEPALLAVMVRQPPNPALSGPSDTFLALFLLQPFIGHPIRGPKPVVAPRLNTRSPAGSFLIWP